MFAGDFQLTRFLRAVSGTHPFREYCLARGIPHGARTADRDPAGWTAEISALPPETRARIQRELAEVSDTESPRFLTMSGENPSWEAIGCVVYR
jgi:hypothetical protein